MSVKIFKSDSYGNRTRVTAVKGRCLDRLTKEPYLYFLIAGHGSAVPFGLFVLSSLRLVLSNSPSWARTNNPTVNSRVLYH